MKSPEGMVQRADDFLDVAEIPANAGLFNLDATRVGNLRALTKAMIIRLDRRHTLENQLSAINAEIKANAPAFESELRSDLRVAAASSASEALKAEADVTIPKPRVNSAPITPTGLVATPNANGTVTLKWDRAGNIRGCKFVIEKIGGAAPVLIDIVTATEETFPAKIGETAMYQVSARNGQGTSLPSNPAVIYPA